MLILTRKFGEAIIIGEIGDIKITVLGNSRDNQVKLGIEAPKHIPVHRQEVFDRIQTNNLASNDDSE